MKNDSSFSGLAIAAASVGLLSLVPVLFVFIKQMLFGIGSQAEGWGESYLALFVGVPAFVLALIFYLFDSAIRSSKRTDRVESEVKNLMEPRQTMDSKSKERVGTFLVLLLLLSTFILFHYLY